MRRTILALPLVLLAGHAAAQGGACDAIAQSQSSANAVAPELAARSARLGAPAGVLAQAYDDSQSVDSVLNRLRVGECREVAAKRTKSTKVAASSAAPAATADAPIDPATYKPKTKDDNTPWRFDMSQNGKRMTAEEFDAWMKARGVRVAKGAPAPAKPADTPASADNEAK
ncbi:hypothetical protein [Aerolutibacter ruishenii]|uniref:Secreted protein n=1 Tax=Aerolutibacter ruishenii TaxID=686800 RepID=A0A562LKM1_9GAMM|nr:hypothetical protein [Lysobacter ruishenii]TWI08155.1 hypothetical protein IP93_02391 [Lysobacter ruishenii]